MTPSRLRAREQAVVKAAMRWYSAYLKIGRNWGYQEVPIGIENGLINYCARLAAARRRRWIHV